MSRSSPRLVDDRVGPVVHPLEGVGDPLADPLRRGRTVGRPRRIVDELVQVLEQVEVAVRAEGRRAPTPVRSAPGSASRCRCASVTGPSTSSGGSSFAISRSRSASTSLSRSRPSSWPSHFSSSRSGSVRRLVEERPEGREVAAQPAGADPHVVHRLVVVGPHPGVTDDDRLDLLGRVGEEGVGRLRPGRRDGRAHVVAEHPVELGAGVAPRHPTDRGTALVTSSSRSVAPPVELDLDLPPLDEVDRPVPRPAGVDDVVGDDRQPRPGRVEEGTARPAWSGSWRRGRAACARSDPAPCRAARPAPSRCHRSSVRRARAVRRRCGGA